MTSERQWTPGKIALVGGGVVAIGWIAYKLLTSNPPPAADQGRAPNGEDDGDDRPGDESASDDSSGGGGPGALPPLPKVGTRSNRSRPAGPTLPKRPERAAKSSTTAGQGNSSSAGEQTRKHAEDKDKPEVPSSAEALRKDAPQGSTDSTASSSQETGKQKQTEKKSKVAEDAPQIAWSQTQEEVTIWISISADVKKQHIGFKLTSTHIEVEVQDVPVLAGPLPFPVQPDDSNWQFDTRQHQRVLAITLQKGILGQGVPVWTELIQGAPGTSVHNQGPDPKTHFVDNGGQP